MDFKIVDLVNQINMQEIVLKKTLDFGVGEDFYCKFMFSKIIGSRMFLYFNEKIIRNQKQRNPQQNYYEHLNAMVEGKETPFRNLVRFEIKELATEIGFDVDLKEIEEFFLIDLHKNIYNAFKLVLKKEQNISISKSDNKDEIEGIIKDLDFQKCSKKYRLKFMLGVLAHVEGIDIEEIYDKIIFNKVGENLKYELKNKFNDFLDIVIGKYFVYDRPEYFICLMLMALESDYEMFKKLDDEENFLNLK